jgi:hypothetical protein
VPRTIPYTPALTAGASGALLVGCSLHAPSAIANPIITTAFIDR